MKDIKFTRKRVEEKSEEETVPPRRLTKRDPNTGKLIHAEVEENIEKEKGDLTDARIKINPETGDRD